MRRWGGRDKPLLSAAHTLEEGQSTSRPFEPCVCLCVCVLKCNCSVCVCVPLGHTLLTSGGSTWYALLRVRTALLERSKK